METTQIIPLNLARVVSASVRLFFQPRVLVIVLLPFLVSTILWIIGGYIAWQIFEPLLLNFGSYLSGQFTFLNSMAEWLAVGSVLVFFGIIALALLIIPMIWITALVLTSVLAMPLIVRVVHGREYSDVQKNGKTDLKFWFEFSKLSILFLMSWLISLFFLLVPIVGFLAPLFVTAYFHYRIVLVDAMSDFATREEIHLIRQKYRTEAFSVGMISALFLSIPFVNFLSPVVSAILFTNFGFAALQNLRKSNHNRTVRA